MKKNIKTVDQMIKTNLAQSNFYDNIQIAENSTGTGGYSLNKDANMFTRFWADLRYKQQAAVSKSGVAETVNKFHTKWIESKKGGEFLEIGCFSGSPCTSILIQKSAHYYGIDLSELAVCSLREKINLQGLDHKALVSACDFLSFQTVNKYDLIYAQGVLHHFENPIPLFIKIKELLKPDGILVFAEPSACNPIYRLIRAIYRPFQSDAAWEWPFSKSTVKVLENDFEIVDGFGWGYLSLPMSVATGFPLIGNIALKAYLPTIKCEVNQGWHKKVWNNSYVTAAYRIKQINS